MSRSSDRFKDIERYNKVAEGVIEGTTEEVTSGVGVTGPAR